MDPLRDIFVNRLSEVKLRHILLTDIIEFSVFDGKIQ